MNLLDIKSKKWWQEALDVSHEDNYCICGPSKELFVLPNKSFLL